MADARAKLEAYYDFVERKHAKLRSSNKTDAKLRKIAKYAVPARFRGTARMVVTDAVMPRSKRVAAELARQPGPLKLHLGSGTEHKDGWINIDLAGDPVDLAWNLAHGIPFPDGSVDGIFHEHLLEHLPLRAGDQLIAECWRVLRPGGVLRIGVPDAGAYARSYASDGEFIESIRPERPTRMLAMQEIFYWNRHLTMYDVETLALLFRANGFRDPEKKAFGETSLDAAPDTTVRKAETLYVEARRVS